LGGALWLSQLCQTGSISTFSPNIYLTKGIKIKKISKNMATAIYKKWTVSVN
jgi:hypothetical protein